MNKPLLMVFLRAAVRGRVKTRLAATVGDDRALAIYTKLVAHTLKVATPLACAKQAWYSDGIPTHEPAAALGFELREQVGDDLGARMQYAFEEGFYEGYGPIIIIGTDLPQLSTALLEEAFTALKDHDAVLGPANDGGYYLLGLNASLDALFYHKAWSTPSVMAATVADLHMHKRSCHLLPELVDVDTEEDLRHVTLP